MASPQPRRPHGAQPLPQLSRRPFTTSTRAAARSPSIRVSATCRSAVAQPSRASMPFPPAAPSACGATRRNRLARHAPLKLPCAPPLVENSAYRGPGRGDRQLRSGPISKRLRQRPCRRGFGKVRAARRSPSWQDRTFRRGTRRRASHPAALICGPRPAPSAAYAELNVWNAPSARRAIPDFSVLQASRIAA